jgi:hypothetical protein
MKKLIPVLLLLAAVLHSEVLSVAILALAACWAASCLLKAAAERY